MKKILTKQDVIDLGNPPVILVPKRTVVTPLAQEHLAARGIEVRQDAGVDRPQALGGADALSGGSQPDGALIATVVEEIARACGGGGQPPDASSGRTPCEHVVHWAQSPPPPGARDESSPGAKAIVSVTGANAPGVAAAICQTIADSGADIVDISQTLVSGFYSMIFVVDITGLTQRGMSLISFRERIQAIAENLGAQAWVMHENVLKAMHRL